MAYNKYDKVKDMFHYVPVQVTISVKNIVKGKTPFTIKHSLDVFGFNNNEYPMKREVIVRVKSILTHMHLTGNYKSDFSALSFKKTDKDILIKEGLLLKSDSDSDSTEKLSIKETRTRSVDSSKTQPLR